MARATVVISAQDKLSPGLQKAKGSVLGFQNAVQSVGNTLKTALGVGTAVIAVKKLTDTLTGSFQAFAEADRKYKQLKITLGSGEAFQSVSDKIKELQRVTLSSKGDIESMVSELAGLGKSANEINAISEAAVALSNVTGQDLNSAMTTLLGSYEGTVKQLQKLVPEVGELSKAELAQGAAIDVVTQKFSELSKAMAEGDTSQHIKNIQDTVGDIGQDLGDVVNTIINPAVQKLDKFFTDLKEKTGELATQAKLVIENFPEVISRLGQALSNGLSNLFSVEGIGAVFNGISSMLMNIVKGIGTALANLGELAMGIGERALKGIGNYAMYWITHITDQLGINISEVVNSAGKWLTESGIGKVVDTFITGVINGLRLIVATIRNIPQIVKIVISNIGTLVSEFLGAIPTAIKELILGIKDYFPAAFLDLKNSFLEAIQSALNTVGQKLQDSWVGKLFGIGGKLAEIDFNIDRTTEYTYADSTRQHFQNAGNAFSGVGSVLSDVTSQINKLMTPTFEKFISDNSKTIGQTMASWSAKSSEEYYEAAKENFSDIGSFLKDWGSTFMGDMSDSWSEISESFSGIFETAFGGEMSAFVDWFKELAKKLGIDPEQDPPPETKGVDFFGTVVEKFTSALGNAGEEISSLVSNISALGPLLGAAAWAVENVLEGFTATISETLNEVLNIIVEPLVALGEILGKMFIPVLQSLAPFLKIVAGVIEALAPVLKVFGYVVTAIAGTIEYVGQTLQHWVASLMNWLAGLNLFGWQPFAGLRMNDPGSPGSYGSFMQTRFNQYEDSLNAAAVTGTSTETAVSSAGYRGATSVTINIYQQSPVVGSNGMREFAAMIRSEFDNLDYYGVTV